MRVIYAILVFAVVSATVVLMRPPITPRTQPSVRFTSPHPVGAWDSIAVVADELWITDKKRGEIVVLNPKSGGQRTIGADLDLAEPNGIDAIERDSAWTVFLVDRGRREVLCLSPAGQLLGRFGNDVFTEPRGLDAFTKDKRTHLVVTDQGKINGCVRHFVLEGTAPVTQTTMAPVEGQVESVAYVASENMVLVANETRRRIEYFRLDASEPAGFLGTGRFRGEPEGIVVWPEANTIVAVDQTGDGRILCFEAGLTAPREFRSAPPLVEPDGACRRGDTLYVVSGDCAVFAFRFTIAEP